MQLRDKIIHDLNIPESLIDEALTYAQTRVIRFHLPKKKGGFRVISQPSNKLKNIHYWLINNVFNQLDISEHATAYREGLSIYHNAKRHIKNNYFLKADLKDFFPSISSKDFLPIIESWHKTKPQQWKYNKEAKKIIVSSCFDKKGFLPIGYPTSPVISNIVMLDFDKKIIDLLNDNSKYGKVVYTRYADDLVFSTNKKDVCNEIYDVLKKLIKDTKSPNIKINSKKVRFSSKSGGSAFITGLRLCEKNHITIHRKYKDKVRLMLSLYAKKKLKEDDHNSLKGHLNYIRYVDAGFYTKLQKKHFESIHEIFSD